MPSSFKNLGSSGTGAIKLPIGTDAQQPGSPAQGMLRYNSTQDRTELYDSSVTDFIPANLKGVVATGGTTYDIDADGQPYRVHVFTSDGTLTVTKGGEVEYLVVAGGGVGGNRHAGGGGAGGALQGKKVLSTGSFNAVVGAGGDISNFPALPSQFDRHGKTGRNSLFGSITNLITNGTFDSNIDNWANDNGFSNGWGSDANIPQHGGHLRTFSDANSSSYFGANQSVTLETGESYTLVFEVIEGGNTAGALRIDGNLFVPLEPGKYLKTFTASGTSATLQLGSNVGAGSGRTTYWDEVGLYKTSDVIVALGGGGGGANGEQGYSGGSGGGDGERANSNTGGLNEATGQGNDGGNTTGTSYGGGSGGGGAGRIGQAAPLGGVSGNGGAGLLTNIIGFDVFYAGGGGGGGYLVDTPGLGGVGGGGNGGEDNTVGKAGVPNTGGGSGGGGQTNDGSITGAGGSGIVVVRYPLYNRTQPGTSLKDVTDGCILDMDFANPRVYKGIGVVADSLGRETGTVNGAVEFADPRTHRSNFNFTNGDSTGQRIDVVRRNGSPWISNSGTLMFWLYADNRASANTYEEIIGVNTYTGDNDGWRFYRYDTTGIRFWETGNQISDSTLGRIIVDEWHHYAMTRDGSTVKIYRDGVQIGNNYTASITNWTGSTLHIGGTFSTSLNGDLGIVRVYDRPLSASELLQHFNFTKWRFGY